jgi:uncharacterized protein (UPF0548 family)
MIAPLNALTIEDVDKSDITVEIISISAPDSRAARAAQPLCST